MLKQVYTVDTRVDAIWHAYVYAWTMQYVCASCMGQPGHDSMVTHHSLIDDVDVDVAVRMVMAGMLIIALVHTP